MSTVGRSEGRVIRIIGTLALIFLVTPMLVLIASSLDPGMFFTFPPRQISDHWYVQLLEDPTWRASILLTLTIAGLTIVGATIIGTGVGIALARMRGRIRGMFYPLLIAPLVVPTIVLAIPFYTVVLYLHLVGNIITFVVANTLLTSPLVGLLVMAAALGMDQHLEFASLSCGASPLRTLLRVTAPLVAPTAIAGGILAFLLTLDEVVMSIFLVAPGKTPLAVQMFLQVQTGTPPIVEAAAAVLITLSILLIGGLSILRVLVRRRGGDLVV
jgi:ABC-type spermidine/putrescine transport system permease subunit II